MNVRHRARLNLEHLEDRWVPASVLLINGTLLISPSPGEAALTLTVRQTAANAFTVTDQGTLLGPFSPVSNLLITGGNGGDSVTVDVNGLNYTGGLLAFTGNGNDTF